MGRELPLRGGRGRDWGVVEGAGLKGVYKGVRARGAWQAAVGGLRVGWVLRSLSLCSCRAVPALCSAPSHCFRKSLGFLCLLAWVLLCWFLPC